MLLNGGKLQALKIRGADAVNTAKGFGQYLNVALPCEWVDIDEIDPAADTLRFEAHAKGAAKFSRGEGMWYGNGMICLVCSNGGEFCGSCFSHDGRFMYVNIQSPGLTLVIEGPWRKGQP